MQYLGPTTVSHSSQHSEDRGRARRRHRRLGPGLQAFVESRIDAIVRSDWVVAGRDADRMTLGIALCVHALQMRAGL